LNTATKIGESTKKLRNDKKHILNSPLNRTYITSKANTLINNKTPFEYLNYVSQFAQWGHCLPTPFKEEYSIQTGETENDYYKQVLKKRYNKLKERILTEIEHYT